MSGPAVLQIAAAAINNALWTDTHASTWPASWAFDATQQPVKETIDICGNSTISCHFHVKAFQGDAVSSIVIYGNSII